MDAKVSKAEEIAKAHIQKMFTHKKYTFHSCSYQTHLVVQAMSVESTTCYVQELK
jgi:hypothetical protein